jgi:hypothetical protein
MARRVDVLRTQVEAITGVPDAFHHGRIRLDADEKGVSDVYTPGRERKPRKP